jgi:hypothetical protein
MPQVPCQGEGIPCTLKCVAWVLSDGAVLRMAVRQRREACDKERGERTVLLGVPIQHSPLKGYYDHIGPHRAAIDRAVEAGVRTGADQETRLYQGPNPGADEYSPPDVLRHVSLPLVSKSWQ